MTNLLKELHEKNSSAYELLIEFLSYGRRSNDLETVRKFVGHLISESIRLGIEKANVNKIFHFIQWNAWRLVIPRIRGSEGECLLFHSSRSRFRFEPEALESGGEDQEGRDAFIAVRLHLQASGEREKPSGGEECSDSTKKGGLRR